MNFSKMAAGLARKSLKPLVSRLTFSVYRRAGTGRVKIPVLDAVGLDNLRAHEIGFDRVLRQLLPKRPGAFVDVGANIGQTLLKVMEHDPARPYLGFEVSPFCCHYLDRLIGMNGFADCTIVPIGLSDRSEVVNLQYSSAHDTQATIAPRFWTEKNAREHRRRVLVLPGDVALAQFGMTPIAFIKIDVEGAELDVLSGLQNTISRDRPLLIVEILPFTPDADDGSDSAAILEARRQRIERLTRLIADMAYVPLRILPDGQLQETCNFDMPTYDSRLCNYVLAPNTDGILAAVQDRPASATFS